MGEVISGPGFRTCSHSGCGWPAVATLGFDYSTRSSWLDDLTPEPQPSDYDLCSIHSGRFRPPRGWSLSDQRRLPQPLFRSIKAEPGGVDGDDSTSDPDGNVAELTYEKAEEFDASIRQAALPDV